LEGDFRAAWERVGALEGETFEAGGQPFRYRFRKTFVVIEPGAQSIPRTHFEKVFKRMQSGDIETAPAVQGQKNILAIYRDGRMKK
jgi:hypothetical protein